MKLRNRIASIALATAALGSASTAMAATMNIPYTAGASREACRDTPQGGIMLDPRLTQPIKACWVDVPLPIDAGHRLDQVSVFYGSNGPRSKFSAYLGYKDLRAARINSMFEGTRLFDFDDNKNVSRDGMAEGKLMAQSQAGVIYPDAFEMDANYAYFVRVMVSDDGEFFGIRATYE